MIKLPMRAVLVVFLFLLSAIAFLDRTNISIAGPQISSEFSLGNVRLGWVISAFLVGYAASQVLAGWIAVRLGPWRALALAVLWWATFTLATALVSPRMDGALLILIAVRAALGVGEAIMYPASNQFVAQWIPARERGTVNGVIFAGVGAGAGLTPPLLAAIISAHGWRAAFWFSAESVSSPASPGSSSRATPPKNIRSFRPPNSKQFAQAWLRLLKVIK